MHDLLPLLLGHFLLAEAPYININILFFAVTVVVGKLGVETLNNHIMAKIPAWGPLGNHGETKKTIAD